jgi:tRNA-dihydrouridine synthase A
MLGRAAYHDPYELARIDRAWFGGEMPDRRAVLEALRPHAQALRARGQRQHHLTRHLVGLFQGMPGARAWRRALSEHGNRPDADWSVVEAALAAMDPHAERDAA